ncbi:uncharacterized protein DS421_18g630570 [Arachis hypogaea]|nr:uncharacterized protein DS421_18g630570 [Arachis hypogaea]
MAMRRNMEMRMAVATKPKETALTELSKLVKWESSMLCTFTFIGDPIGAHPPLLLLLLFSSTTISFKTTLML